MERSFSVTKNFVQTAGMVAGVWGGLQFGSMPAQCQVLKVLSVNLNNEVTVEDKDYRFRDHRFKDLVQWIKQNDPDIVLMQEAYNFHNYGSVAKALGEALGYDYNYRIGMGFPLVMYDSNGVLAKKKFKMSERRFAKLPHGAPWMGDGQNWIVVFGAISWAVGSRLTLEDGSPFYVYTTHLIGNSQTDRDDQMWGIDQDIRAHVESNGEDYEKAHVMVTGDFNSDPTTPGVRKLLANGYHDTFAEAHPSEALLCSNCSDPTTLEFNPMTIAPGLFPAQDDITGNDRIDYILTHGPAMQTVASTMVFTGPLQGVWMSDHYGMFSTINVGGAPVDTSAYANPLRDRTDLGKLTQIVHVTAGMMQCQAVASELGQAASALSTCDLPTLGQVSWEHGVTFINDTTGKITVRVRPRTPGAGQVWAKEQIDLDSGKATAYFFDPGFDYVFGVKEASSAVFGSLQSDLP